MKRRFLKTLSLMLCMTLFMGMLFGTVQAAEVNGEEEASILTYHVEKNIDSEGKEIVTTTTTEEYFATLKDALTEASKRYEATKKEVAVRLENNVTVTENLDVPKGVLLIVPCVDDDQGYIYHNEFRFNHDGTDASGAVGVGPNANCYCTLTIADGVRLNVRGTVLINSVTGRPSGGNYDQDVTGGYGQIQLAGNGYITIVDGGNVECFGYVRGTGTIKVYSGGTVGDLFVVRNWRGGTHGYEMYKENVYPMNESDCQNIEVKLEILSGGTLNGLVKMYAGEQYNYTRFPQVNNENGLIRLQKNATLIRTIDVGNESITGDEREVYSIRGGADIAKSTLKIVGVMLTTADFLYPIDGDTDFILSAGEYSFVNDYKFMPGATMTVKGNADLRIANGSSVVFYDEYIDPAVDGTAYPLRGAASLTLEKGSTLTNAGIFAGTVYTEEENIFGEYAQYNEYDKYGDLVGNWCSPVWSLTTKEANGYMNEVKRCEEFTFDLNPVREGYSWSFGCGDDGTEKQNIHWFSQEGTGFTSVLTSSSKSAVKLQVETFNANNQAVSGNVYVAAYAGGKMVGIKSTDVFTLLANCSMVQDVEVPTSTQADEVRILALNGDTLPLGAMLSKPLVGE